MTNLGCSDRLWLVLNLLQKNLNRCGVGIVQALLPSPLPLVLDVVCHSGVVLPMIIVICFKKNLCSAITVQLKLAEIRLFFLPWTLFKHELNILNLNILFMFVFTSCLNWTSCAGSGSGLWLPNPGQSSDITPISKSPNFFTYSPMHTLSCTPRYSQPTMRSNTVCWWCQILCLMLCFSIVF